MRVSLPAVTRGKRRRAGLVALGFLFVAAPAFAEVEPAFSVEAGSPQKLSANLGIRIGVATPSGKPNVGRGFLLQVQPGLGGGAVNVGWTPINLSAWGAQAVGIAVRARVLRTWGSPWMLEPNQTFAGVELEAAWIVKVSLGVLTRVQGNGGRATAVTWSFGVGL